MSKLIALFSMLLFSTALSAKPQQTIPPIDKTAYQHFQIQQYDMNADEQRSYRIYIAVPNTPPPTSGYPVLYMLDGNGQFPLAVNSYHPDNGPAPLIIAIGYPGDVSYNTVPRTRDYTPPAEGEEFAQGGKAEIFNQFINQQLKPWVNQHYAVNQQKQTLAGHSFGGLFTLYTLFNHPQQFQHYVAASPSLWWGNGVVIPASSPLLSQWPESILVTVGEYEEKPNPADANKPQDAERAKRQAKRQQVTKARALAAEMKQQGGNVNFILFPGKNHGSVIPDAIKAAVITAGKT
ncbi:alpha/beta hydrolase [Limnobaculum xujianqingii]|uniref:alpha/beta hydrolase n=1 Tax=Limnobaculum xujianqingii TaxID=2738837 RepID=UPI001E58D609|nr:alpha/beta hydrolase-fold protein [Limnobaculum xujianqingii]